MGEEALNLQDKNRKKYDRVLVVIAAPPASGKSFVGKGLARCFKDSVYLDLDNLNPLSERICAVAGEDFNKGGDFFKENGRDYEYEALFSFVWETLEFSRVVIVTAPFTKEIRDEARFRELEQMAERRHAKLIPVWILSDEDVCRRNMQNRGASRDKWKRADFKNYIESIDFERPPLIPEEFQVDNRTWESCRVDTEKLAAMIREILGT